MKVYVDFEDLDEKTFTKNALIYINRKKDIDYVEQIKIQSLTDYTKQVRKEVVQEIKNKIEQAKMIYEWKGKEITIEDILDQIQ